VVMKTQRIVTKGLFDKDQYVNKDTGELLSSEKPEISVYTGKPIELAEVKYKEFVITNNAAMAHIREDLGNSVSGHIISMAMHIQGHSNTVTKDDNKTPHDSESLQKLLKYSRNKYYDFINKLIRKDIVHEVRRMVGGKIVKTIVLNPSVATRTRKVDLSLLEVFHDLSEGLPSLDIEEVRMKLEKHQEYLNKRE
jgi:hypothetical protein